MEQKGLFLAVLLVLVSGSLALPTPRVETDPELTAGYYQGDIIPSDILSQRNGMRNESFRWPDKTVFYYINRNIDQEHRDHIIRGIRILERNSCLKFKEASSDQPYYVNVTWDDGGCFSYVGNENRVQQLNLQKYDLDTGCFRLGTIVHEFLHAIGFFHQQSTSNRDDYVRIVEENIQPETLSNFDKYDDDYVDDYDQEYDYGSVMHYPPYAFSANGEMTIVPLKEGAEKEMGQRVRMSKVDINKLNMMYNCPRPA